MFGVYSRTSAYLLTFLNIDPRRNQLMLRVLSNEAPGDAALALAEMAYATGDKMQVVVKSYISIVLVGAKSAAIAVDEFY